ncbi:MAG: RlmE family RNA methyltransferase [Candidatus Peregrinibacteria bacterium]|nr:RlmE family RNA methyltransferase [Candidatus Peregrinibacteria bacterium]MCB9808726.1 RlmE family RNA methyltransferase [Candidatus Peribacteria bacterium]
MPKRYTPNDNWARKAAEEGYRARSVYKLKELDEKFKLIRPGMTVVDLGAAPGSWLQYVSGKMCGRIIGIDLQEIEPIDGVETVVANIADEEALKNVLPEKIDVLLSDLAPKTSGVKDVDQWKSIELSEAVLDVARSHLKPGGRCVMKILRGADFDEFLRDCKRDWKDVKTYIPEACRDRSKEIYVLLCRP